MPDAQTSFRLSAMRATPYPNRLLDLSVTLPETQGRLVNLIVRVTLGWHAGSPGERRATISLSLWQLKRRVGRSSVRPVAEGVAALVRAGVLEIRDADGSTIQLASLFGIPRKTLRIGLARSWVEEG